MRFWGLGFRVYEAFKKLGSCLGSPCCIVKMKRKAMHPSSSSKFTRALSGKWDRSYRGYMYRDYIPSFPTKPKP